MMRTILTALALLALLPAAHAQSPGWCADGYTAQRWNGERVIVCPPHWTAEEYRRFMAEQRQAFEREQARLRTMATGCDLPHGDFRRSPSCP